MSTSLVLGASGFLGSHVVRELLAVGSPVRALVRPTSSLRGLEGLDVELVHGDVRDPASIRAAMDGCADVYHCAVDARAWLRDPAPLFATNVEALPPVLDAVLDVGVRRFVFTSTIATLATDPRVRRGDYVRSRVEAEQLVLRHCRTRRLPGIAMCVANTYGPGDLLPTPHGGMVFAAALGRLPFYVRGASADVVAVDEAARAMVLAAEHGTVGERYAIAERRMSMREVVSIGASVGGVRPPRWGVPRAGMVAAGLVGEQVARVRGHDVPLTRTTARLMDLATLPDDGRAVRDLGWKPRSTTDAIREGVEWFLSRRSRRAARATGRPAG